MRDTKTQLMVTPKKRVGNRAHASRKLKQRGMLFTYVLDIFRPRRIKKAIAKPITTHADDGLKHLACTCSVVALHAQLAKLSGDLSTEAFLEFRCLFPIGDAESKNLRYLFTLAWEDEAPKQHHVNYILQHFPHNAAIHQRLVEGLARQMLAAHAPSKKELDWLHELAEDFGMTRITMRQILARAEKPLEASPYQLFNVPKKATKEQVKQAYRRMMLKCHPDKVATATLPETKAAAEKLATAATLAYKRLACR